MTSQQADSRDDATGTANGTGPQDARTRILRAAAGLIAEKGLHGVSLREITRAAGQRNTTALQYHFGSRDGMLRALMDLHVPRVSVRRETLLDLFESREVTAREAAGILVTPLVGELTTPEGRDFLQVAAQLVNQSDRLVDAEEPVGALVYDPAGTLERWVSVIDPHMPPGTGGAPLHRRFAAIRFTHIELGRRARVAPNANADLFASQLVDLVAALLTAELSPETQRHLNAR